MFLNEYSRNLLDGAEDEEARVIDEIVDRADSLDFLGNALLGLVEVQLDDLAARRLDLLHGIGRLGLAAHRADDLVTGLGGFQAQQQPEAVGGAGNEPD